MSGMQEMVASVAVAVGSGQQFGRQEGQFGAQRTVAGDLVRVSPGEVVFDASLVTQGSQSSQFQSSASQLPLCVCVSDSAAPWTAAFQASLTMGFSRQEYWSGLLFPSPGHLPDSGIEPHISGITGRFFTAEPPVKLSFLYILALMAS